MIKEKGYVALCYHYLRTPKNSPRFSRILGNTLHDFLGHLELFKSHYQIISPEDAYNFSSGNESPLKDRYGILITFDDGLSDHYEAACILAERGIKAFFFVPTCFLADGLPANPTIIHYALAVYKINGFLKVYRQALDTLGLDAALYDIRFQNGRDDPWEAIKKIKEMFKYKLAYRHSREALLFIYRRLLLKDFPGALKIMHLSKKQVEEILQMGHSIGAHSHTHISVAAGKLSETELNNEVAKPAEYLRHNFGQAGDTFSYPFGAKEDCLACEKMVNACKEYKLVYTVEEILNTRQTNLLGLGRYMPKSTDDPVRLGRKIEAIISKPGA